MKRKSTILVLMLAALLIITGCSPEPENTPWVDPLGEYLPEKPYADIPTLESEEEIALLKTVVEHMNTEGSNKALYYQIMTGTQDISDTGFKGNIEFTIENKDMTYNEELMTPEIMEVKGTIRDNKNSNTINAKTLLYYTEGKGTQNWKLNNIEVKPEDDAFKTIENTYTVLDEAYNCIENESYRITSNFKEEDGSTSESIKRFNVTTVNDESIAKWIYYLHKGNETHMIKAYVNPYDTDTCWFTFDGKRIPDDLVEANDLKGSYIYKSEGIFLYLTSPGFFEN